MRKSVLILFLFIFLAACKERATGKGAEIDADAIYFNYRISGGEDKEEVTCLFQFHLKRPQGATLLLEKPSMVKLDGEEVTADSTPVTGSFYEVQKPLETFTGDHNITFIDLNQKEYRETFSFAPFILQTELPPAVPRQDIVLPLAGLDVSDTLSVVLTDTAFATDDVQAKLPVNNGQLTIPRQQLEQVISGPVFLSLSKEEERPVKAATKAGGRIVISYSLRREFMLVN